MNKEPFLLWEGNSEPSVTSLELKFANRDKHLGCARPGSQAVGFLGLQTAACKESLSLGEEQVPSPPRLPREDSDTAPASCVFLREADFLIA